MFRSDAIKFVTERRPNSPEVYTEPVFEADQLDRPGSPLGRFVTQMLKELPEFSDAQLEALEEYFGISGSVHHAELPTLRAPSWMEGIPWIGTRTLQLPARISSAHQSFRP